MGWLKSFLSIRRRRRIAASCKDSCDEPIHREFPSAVLRREFGLHDSGELRSSLSVPRVALSSRLPAGHGEGEDGVASCANTESTQDTSLTITPIGPSSTGRSSLPRNAISPICPAHDGDKPIRKTAIKLGHRIKNKMIKGDSNDKQQQPRPWMINSSFQGRTPSKGKGASTDLDRQRRLADEIATNLNEAEQAFRLLSSELDSLVLK